MAGNVLIEHVNNLSSPYVSRVTVYSTPLEIYIQHNVMKWYFSTATHAYYTLTTNFRYRRLGDLNHGPATLCACAGGEQQTIIKIVIHFL